MPLEVNSNDLSHVEGSSKQLSGGHASTWARAFAKNVLHCRCCRQSSIFVPMFVACIFLLNHQLEGGNGKTTFVILQICVNEKR